MKRLMLAFLVFIVSTYTIYQTPLRLAQEPAQQQQQQEDPFSKEALLKDILKQTAEYCEKIKTVALEYVCVEDVADKFYRYKVSTARSVVGDNTAAFPTSAQTEGHSFSVSEFADRKSLTLKNSKKTTYKYDYQLIKKGGRFEEKRILLEENKRKKNEKNAQLKTRFKASNLIFGPVGFLSKYWQRYFDYEIVGMEMVNDVQTIVVKATPTEANKDNRNFAKIWVDVLDFSILQIEWEPQSIEGFESKIKESEVGDLKTNIVWTVTYAVAKNGVRFPSSQAVKEVYIGLGGEIFPIEEISFDYNNYKFFVVETEIKH
ncbi:MAG: hypothetical protein GQ544_02790 [Candidatus Aminicenantes bacterium]|nr:hypothetical protein [Candidatus Aminicenantes bacterium]